MVFSTIARIPDVEAETFPATICRIGSLKLFSNLNGRNIIRLNISLMWTIFYIIFFQIFLLVGLIHISTSSGENIVSNNSDNSSIQKIPKIESHLESQTDNSVIEKVPARHDNRNRVPRQIITPQRINSVFGYRRRLINYPVLSGFVNRNDRFPTVA